MRYREYKKVDLPWLDELPSHWDISKFKRFTNNTGMGRMFLNADLDYYATEGTIPVYSATQSNKVLGYTRDKSLLLKQGDFVIPARGNSIGYVKLIKDNEATCSQTTIYSRIRDINKKFLYYSCYGFKNEWFHFTDTAIPQITVKQVENNYVLVPPKEEQEQIARFLDWKINEIDRLISIRGKQIKNLEKTRRILIIDTMLNNDYKRVMLSRCVSENKRKNTNSYQNLLSLSYGKIIRKDINSTFGLLPAKFDKYQLVDKGNIILRLTDLQNDHKSLRVGLVEETGIITSAYIGLICNNNVIPEYLYYYLNAMDLRKDFYSMGAGVRQNLNYNELRKINIKLPDKDTQKYIIDYLNENEIRIKKIIKSKEKQINNLEKLKKSLISDVVTGKIDVRKIFVPEYDKVSDIENDTVLEENFNEEV